MHSELLRRYRRACFVPGLCIALAPILLYLAAQWTGTALWDDAFMFARYARHWLSGGDISWNPDNRPTYGLTSLGYFFYLLPFLSVSWTTPALALWWASASSGALCILLLLIRAWKSSPADSSAERWLQLLFVAIILGAAAPELSVHMTSGMDTCFSLAWITATLGLMEQRSERVSSARAPALWIGLTFIVRPDALLLLLPAWLLLQATFRHSCVEFLKVSAVVLLQVAAARVYFGSWLPNPFYVKSSTLYDPAFYDFFKGATLHYLLLFFSALPWVVLAIGAQMLLLRRSFSRRQAAFLASTTLFAGYQLLYVTPIMGEHARFYFPALPLLCAVSTEALVQLKRWAEARYALTEKLQRVRFPAVFLLCVAAAVTLQFDSLADAIHEIQVARHRPWNLNEIYHARYEKSWAKLDAVSALPSSTEIAATEVGLLGLMNIDKTIVDLTGLHDSRFITGFAAEKLWKVPPDILYMPFPHYRAMTAAIESDPYFRTEYLYLTADALDARFGVALRKSSPVYAELKKIFTE